MVPALQELAAETERQIPRASPSGHLPSVQTPPLMPTSVTSGKPLHLPEPQCPQSVCRKRMTAPPPPPGLL